jgi:hypothetical protein
VQLVLPLGLAVLLAVVVENSSQHFVADMATVDMPHGRLLGVLQHTRSQIADILPDLQRLEGVVVQAVLVLVGIGFCLDRRRKVAGRPSSGTFGSPTW